MKRSYLATALLLLTIVIAIAVPASAPSAGAPAFVQSPQFTGMLQRQVTKGANATPAAGYAASNTQFTIFLPVVMRNQHSYHSCSENSPFSLEIAALHQVRPAAGQARMGQDLAEAEWLARYEKAFPTLVEALADSGACWARIRVDWAWIQPDPPPADYVWQPYHDEKLRLVAESGVQLIAIVDGVPEWAGDSSFGPIDPDRLDEFGQFLTDLVNRYQQPPYNIHHWELFNEPDKTFPAGGARGWGLNGDRYAQMAAAAYAAIKAADPQATVLMGGLAYDAFIEQGGPFHRYFPDDVVGNGGADSFDVTNFHYFPAFHDEWERWDSGNRPTCGIVDDGQGTAYDAGGIDVFAKATHLRNRLRTCFDVDKPLWITELGEHGRAGDSDSLAQQSRYLIQGHARALAAGVENITWFVLVSPPYDPGQQGLLYEDDWSPKPAFYTYQTLTYELAGYAYASTLDATGVEGYVFGDAHGQGKTAAWSKDPQAPAPLTFRPATKLRVVDRLGHVTFVADGGAGDADGTQDGAVTLQMTADPVFVSP